MAYFTRNKAILDRGDRRVLYSRVRDAENADMDLNESQIIHYENRGVAPFIGGELIFFFSIRWNFQKNFCFQNLN